MIYSFNIYLRIILRPRWSDNFQIYGKQEIKKYNENLKKKSKSAIGYATH